MLRAFVVSRGVECREKVDERVLYRARHRVPSIGDEVVHVLKGLFSTLIRWRVLRVAVLVRRDGGIQESGNAVRAEHCVNPAVAWIEACFELCVSALASWCFAAVQRVHELPSYTAVCCESVQISKVGRDEAIEIRSESVVHVLPFSKCRRPHVENRRQKG